MNLNIDTYTRTDTRKLFIINENLLYSSRNSNGTVIFIFNVHTYIAHLSHIKAICAKKDDINYEKNGKLEKVYTVKKN